MSTPLPKLRVTKVQMVETKMSLKKNQSELVVAAIAEKMKSHFLFGVG